MSATGQQIDVVITLRCDVPDDPHRTDKHPRSTADLAARAQDDWFHGKLDLHEVLDRADRDSLRIIVTPAA